MGFNLGNSDKPCPLCRRTMTREQAFRLTMIADLALKIEMGIDANQDVGTFRRRLRVLLNADAARYDVGEILDAARLA